MSSHIKCDINRNEKIGNLRWAFLGIFQHHLWSTFDTTFEPEVLKNGCNYQQKEKKGREDKRTEKKNKKRKEMKIKTKRKEKKRKEKKKEGRRKES